jgi:UDP-N-acetylglucosamine:LPS N-acetylglucosamine transferase
LINDRELLAHMAENAKQAGRPHAAREIARELLNLERSPK